MTSTKITKLTLCASLFFCLQIKSAVRKDPPATIHGAVYVPSDAYNAPQLWKDFSAAETRRDFGYARAIHVNALRVWASYEFWSAEPAKFGSELDIMLGVAHENGIRVLLSLFENDGAPYC